MRAARWQTFGLQGERRLGDQRECCKHEALKEGHTLRRCGLLHDFIIRHLVGKRHAVRSSRCLGIVALLLVVECVLGLREGRVLVLHLQRVLRMLLMVRMLLLMVLVHERRRCGLGLGERGRGRGEGREGARRRRCWSSGMSSRSSVNVRGAWQMAVRKRKG